MYTQFFGNFLLKKEIISPEQLMEALRIQSSAHQKVGTLAIHAGYMSASEVEDVYIMQTHYDKRFGELAIQLGYLTHEQLNELLEIQLPDYMMLGQTLVEKDYITTIDFENLITEYKSIYEIDDLSMASEQQELVDKLLSSFCIQEDIPHSNKLIPYLTLFFNNLVRFIGQDFTPLQVIALPEVPTNFCVSQSIVGPLEITSALDMMPQTAISFACRYVDDEFTQFDEYVHASMEDFLNLHNGLFTVNMSNDYSLELSLQPPVTYEHTTFVTDTTCYLIPIIYPFGTVHFIISIKN
ncbi:MAG: chemotaxis protein CheX [Lachnospiraceae bacterium]